MAAEDLEEYRKAQEQQEAAARNALAHARIHGNEQAGTR